MNFSNSFLLLSCNLSFTLKFCFTYTLKIDQVKIIIFLKKFQKSYNIIYPLFYIIFEDSKVIMFKIHTRQCFHTLLLKLLWVNFEDAFETHSLHYGNYWRDPPPQTLGSPNSFVSKAHHRHLYSVNNVKLALYLMAHNVIVTYFIVWIKVFLLNFNLNNEGVVGQTFWRFLNVLILIPSSCPTRFLLCSSLIQRIRPTSTNFHSWKLLALPLLRRFILSDLHF